MSSEHLEQESKRYWPLFTPAIIAFALVVSILQLWDIVLVLFILLLLNLSWRLSSRSKSIKEGHTVLDYGNGMTWFALISALILSAILIYDALTFDPVRLNQPDANMTERAMMSMGLFVILVWPMFIEGTFTWYILSDKGISKHSAWSRKMFLRWDEIESIEFTAINDWFVIKGSTGTVRLHSYLIGLPEYARSVMEHVPEERWSSVKEHIEQLASMCDEEDVNSSNGITCKRKMS